jgi:hypothetical protein
MTSFALVVASVKSSDVNSFESLKTSSLRVLKFFSIRAIFAGVKFSFISKFKVKVFLLLKTIFVKTSNSSSEDFTLGSRDPADPKSDKKRRERIQIDLFITLKLQLLSLILNNKSGIYQGKSVNCFDSRYG